MMYFLLIAIIILGIGLIIINRQFRVAFFSLVFGYVALFWVDALLFYSGKSPLFPAHQNIMALVAPPEDYYVPIAKRFVMPKQRNYEMDCLHKYGGRYEVSLDMPAEPMPWFNNVQYGPEMEVVISSNGKVVIKQKVTPNANAFLVLSNEQRLTCLLYSVNEVHSSSSSNETLTVGDPVKIKVSFIDDFETFLGKWPNCQLTVSKKSDY